MSDKRTAKNTIPLMEKIDHFTHKEKGDKEMLEIIGLIVLCYFGGKFFVKGMRKEAKKDKES